MTDSAMLRAAAGPVTVDLDRVRSYLRSGPGEVPPAAEFLAPGRLAADVLWPLIARRNLKRLLRSLLHSNGGAGRVEHQAVVSTVVGLSDPALTAFLTEPEVTSWLAGVEGDPGWDGLVHLPHLGSAVVAAAARDGRPCPPLVVGPGREGLRLRPLGVDVRLGAGIEEVVRAEAGSGRVDLRWPAGRTEMHLQDGRPVATGAVTELPRTIGGAVVAGFPDAWLEVSFPDSDTVLGGSAPAAELAAKVSAGMALVARAWPEMAVEVESLLRRVVPVAGGDSFFVPGYRGLVALPDHHPSGLALNIVHELSHNVMSSLYELVDVLRNPDDLAFSPFSRERGPLSSLIHSCWAFSHERRSISRMAAMDLLDEETDWDRVLTKIRIFFDQALPIVRAEAALTPYGRALMDAVTAEAYG